MTNIVRLSKKLNELLSDEHKALLGGELVEIERLGTEKVKLLEEISALSKPEINAFKSARYSLVRNESLAKQTIVGMRKAISRVWEIRDVSVGLRTYAADGQKNHVLMQFMNVL